MPLHPNKKTKNKQQERTQKQKNQKRKTITRWCGQAVLAVSQVFWTAECEEALNKGGNAGLKNYVQVKKTKGRKEKRGCYFSCHCCCYYALCPSVRPSPP